MLDKLEGWVIGVVLVLVLLVQVGAVLFLEQDGGVLMVSPVVYWGSWWLIWLVSWVMVFLIVRRVIWREPVRWYIPVGVLSVVCLIGVPVYTVLTFLPRVLRAI